ncbi:proline-rich protein HaeIII subfamily 1 isoform X1 [Nilaparvata lugens]|uniref:proline-rich protein HaeIII subfamily 1 isoform X1 n=1 Tax=Nilaparvata lugens TaxID=108931 RepID=UPI00193CDF74|nr:proline-rich protein HaeIII subfamily 1 isoform X1 [Nilaparvata lugens]
MMMLVLATLNILFIVIEGYPPPSPDSPPNFWGVNDDAPRQFFWIPQSPGQSSTSQQHSSSRQSPPNSPPANLYGSRYPSPPTYTYSTGYSLPGTPNTRPWNSPPQPASPQQQPSPPQPASPQRQPSPPQPASPPLYGSRYPSPPTYTYSTGYSLPGTPNTRPWNSPPQPASPQQQPSPPQPASPQRQPSPPQPASPQRQPSPPQHAPPQPSPQRQSSPRTRKRRQREVTMPPNTIVELSDIMDYNFDGKINYSDYKRMQEGLLYRNPAVHDHLQKIFGKNLEHDRSASFMTKTAFGSCPIDLATLNGGKPFTQGDIQRIFKISFDVATAIIVSGNSSVTAEDLASYLKSSRRNFN